MARTDVDWKSSAFYTSAMTSISKLWDSSIVPTLTSYIRIPAKSPHFDKDWAKFGYIDEVVELAVRWCREHPAKGRSL